MFSVDTGKIFNYSFIIGIIIIGIILFHDGKLNLLSFSFNPILSSYSFWYGDIIPEDMNACGFLLLVVFLVLILRFSKLNPKGTGDGVGVVSTRPSFEI